MKASILICSLNRPEMLKSVELDLSMQSEQDFEVLVCQEKGRLVELKDKLWRKAKGEFLVWIDDDIHLTINWLQELLITYNAEDIHGDKFKQVLGTTGPTIVPAEYLKNRDVFKGGGLYNWLFLDGKMFYPGRISSWGASTLGANFSSLISNRYQEVDFLEPSQFSMRREVVEEINGFDLGYEGVSEWCDVDMCYRAKRRFDGYFIYSPYAITYHYPVRDAIADQRLETASRYRNYCRFASKFIKNNWKNKTYRAFLRSYFYGKEKGWF